jgi:hypothetical protein
MMGLFELLNDLWPSRQMTSPSLKCSLRSFRSLPIRRLQPRVAELVGLVSGERLACLAESSGPLPDLEPVMHFGRSFWSTADAVHQPIQGRRSTALDLSQPQRGFIFQPWVAATQEPLPRESAKNPPEPQRGSSNFGGLQPLQGDVFSTGEPQVARASQPGADGSKPRWGSVFSHQTLFMKKCITGSKHPIKGKS